MSQKRNNMPRLTQMQDDTIGRAKLKLFDQDAFKILNLWIYAETNIRALRDRKKLKKTQRQKSRHLLQYRYIFIQHDRE